MASGQYTAADTGPVERVKGSVEFSRSPRLRQLFEYLCARGGRRGGAGEAVVVESSDGSEAPTRPATP